MRDQKILRNSWSVWTCSPQYILPIPSWLVRKLQHAPMHWKFDIASYKATSLHKHRQYFMFTWKLQSDRYYVVKKSIKHRSFTTFRVSAIETVFTLITFPSFLYHLVYLFLLWARAQHHLAWRIGRTHSIFSWRYLRFWICCYVYWSAATVLSPCIKCDREWPLFFIQLAKKIFFI